MSAFDDFFAHRLADQPAHVAELAREMCDEVRATARTYLALVELEDEPIILSPETQDAFAAGVEAGLLATMSTFRRRRMLRGDTGEVAP